MATRGDLLRRVMRDQGMTQSRLARISGVHQPSISQFLSNRTELSDEMLERLLACLGLGLEVERRATPPDLRRSEERSWRLHRRVSEKLTTHTLMGLRRALLANVERRRSQVRGQPHERNLDRWQELIESGDLAGLRRVLTGLDRDSIEMREVSPMSGVLTEEERLDVLAGRS